MKLFKWEKRNLKRNLWGKEKVSPLNVSGLTCGFVEHTRLELVTS